MKTSEERSIGTRVGAAVGFFDVGVVKNEEGTGALVVRAAMVPTECCSN